MHGVAEQIAIRYTLSPLFCPAATFMMKDDFDAAVSQLQRHDGLVVESCPRYAISCDSKESNA